jgi:hypothetical protein
MVWYAIRARAPSPVPGSEVRERIAALLHMPRESTLAVATAAAIYAVLSAWFAYRARR